MHELIIGPTLCGKTTLAKEKARAYLARGVHVLVCDPFLDDWPCSWKTTSRDEFIAYAKKSRRCALFIDEAGQTVARSPEAEWPFTIARHWGHKTHVLAQGFTQLLPIQRNQCATLNLFADTNPDECAKMAATFNEPRLATACTLPAYHFFMKTRGQLLRGPLKVSVP